MGKKHPTLGAKEIIADMEQRVERTEREMEISNDERDKMRERLEVMEAMLQISE